MPIDRPRLRDQLVYVEWIDARRVHPDASGYLQAARALREAVMNDLATLPMRDFVHGDLPALQTIAQNVFFETRGRFADLDGSGSAVRAAEMADALLDRLARPRR